MPSSGSLLAAQRRGQRIVVPQPVPVVAPIKGWNTRDPFEAMDPQDAVLLDNLFPDYGGVNARGGSTPFASGMSSGPVQTLAEFYKGSTRKLVAAAGGKLFDISNGGITGATLVGYSLLSDVWQTVNFQGYLFFLNGLDIPLKYDGTTVSQATFTGSGLVPRALKAAGVFDNRLYFWTGEDANFWYGGVNSIAGTLSKFPLDTVSQSGGKLLAVQLLTYDGGTGISDYKCFFMDSGELLVYAGTDPSNANNWALEGRYVIPPAIAIRAITRYGGDIYISTENDHLRLSQIMTALKLGEVPPRSKISGAQITAWREGSTLSGWQALYYPRGTRLIFNIPRPSGLFEQHVYNTSTQAWSRFTGHAAHCWGLFKGKLYFGGADGAVYEADTGSVDVTLTGPQTSLPWVTGSKAIPVRGQQAWQTLETLARKRLTAMRPLVQIGSSEGQYEVSLGFDFRQGLGEASVTVDAVGEIISPWGSPWGSPWTSEITVDPGWLVAEGTGTQIGITLTADAVAPLSWIRTDILYEIGASL